MKRLPKHLRKEIGRCRSCNDLIWWGYRYGRPFPYNVSFEKDGMPYRRNPHKETCPFASEYQPRSRGNLRARADAHTEAQRRWRRSCDSVLKYYTRLDWSRVTIHDVPDRHAIRIAVKLTERGGPFEAWHSLELVPHCLAVAVSDRKVRWVMLTDGIYNRIHFHLYDFYLSLTSSMLERLPVTVAGYRLEPIRLLPKLPWTQLRGFSLAEVYTLRKEKR